MKAGVALSLMCLAMSAMASDHPRPSPYEPLERDADEAPAPKTKSLDVRATQINRCADAKGRIVLQDLPCGPVALRAASVPDATATPATPAATDDVVDLAHLEKRPLPEVAVREARDPESNHLMHGLASGAWKLGLLLAFCYGVYWVATAVRNHFRMRQMVADLEADNTPYARSIHGRNSRGRGSAASSRRTR